MNGSLAHVRQWAQARRTDDLKNALLVEIRSDEALISAIVEGRAVTNDQMVERLRSIRRAVADAERAFA